MLQLQLQSRARTHSGAKRAVVLLLQLFLGGHALLAQQLHAVGIQRREGVIHLLGGIAAGVAGEDAVCVVCVLEI